MLSSPSELSVAAPRRVAIQHPELRLEQRPTTSGCLLHVASCDQLHSRDSWLDIGLLHAGC
eukprot:5214579-Alexandrium_andersonii.AAC.1